MGKEAVGHVKLFSNVGTRYRNETKVWGSLKFPWNDVGSFHGMI